MRQCVRQYRTNIASLGIAVGVALWNGCSPAWIDDGASRRSERGEKTAASLTPDSGGVTGNPPMLIVSDSSLSFSKFEDIKTLEIRNNGTGTVGYLFATSEPWLWVTPQSGTCGATPKRVNVVVNRSEAPYGKLSAVITVRGLTTEAGIQVTVENPDPRGLAEFPYFQYLIQQQQLDLVNDTNQHVILRPFVSNLWSSSAANASSFIADYRSRVPGAVVGRYVSCVFASPSAPPGALERFLPNVPSEWLLRRSNGSLYIVSQAGQSRTCVDLTIPAARSAMIDFWYQSSIGWDWILVDHFYYKYTSLFTDCVHGKQAWDAAMLQLLVDYKARYSKPILLNTITRPEQTWGELIPLTRGLFYESALGASAYFPQPDARLAYFTQELAAYRAALDAGKYVLICNNNAWAGISNDEQASAAHVAGPLLSAAVCLLRNPGEPFWYNTNITMNNDHQPRDFHDWWRRLGTPIGPMYWNRSRCMRDFSRGRIELDITTDRPVIRVTIDGVQQTWNSANYVDPPPPLGDANCDGHFDFFDIDPFMTAVLDPLEYEVRFSHCPISSCDIDQNGSVNVFDVGPFIQLFVN